MGYLQIEKDMGLGVATVWLDQPEEKINMLSLATFDEFKGCLDSLEQDELVKGVVIISKKPDCFIAGADLTKILEIKDPAEGEKISREANLFLKRLAAFPKPIVAAINGTTFGGGVEVALACHYRIATDHPKTVMALPEVKLGLIPAAGATQRLPRLIGLQAALGILLTGSSVYPGKAKKIGMVNDVIHPYGLLRAAKIAAGTIGQRQAQKRKTTWMQKLLEGNPLGRRLLYKGAQKEIQKSSGGHYPAPLKILECVKTGLKQGMEQGFEAEAKNFGELAGGKIAKELIRIGLNRLAHKKNPYPSPRPVKRIAILGSGFMGAGIANVAALRQEVPVLMKDVSEQSLAYAEKTIWQDLDSKVKKRSISSFQRDVVMSRIATTTDYHGFAKADVVVEAVFEDLELKRKVLKEVEEVVPEHCIFASNTSCIPIAEIAAQARRPEQVIGTHYFSPVPVMELLEIIVTDKTPEWVVATTCEMAIRQGKLIIVVKDGPGFYTTRILAPYLNEAIALLEEGVAVDAIDKAMKQFGFPVGPIALLDEVGIDVGAHVSKIMGRIFSARGATSGVLDKLVAADYKGRKNKKGFYLYLPKKRGKKRVNPQVYGFFGGPRRKAVDVRDIQSRLSLIMANEAVHCLAEGILKSPEDGDVGAIFGLGFPPFLGGPLRYLDAMGIAGAVAALEGLAAKHGGNFAPAPLLKEMASRNKTFYK